MREPGRGKAVHKLFWRHTSHESETKGGWGIGMKRWVERDGHLGQIPRIHPQRF